MTSYMYNPSKKVTELLSEYLEFDPEELRVGIWSGDLSLRNVNLRQEAIYPLLNSFTSTTTPDGRPPLRFQLLQGTIGALDMKIPWKRLVWGNGDVKVTLRNVVLVVTVESRDETRQRLARKKSRRASTPRGITGLADSLLFYDDPVLEQQQIDVDPPPDPALMSKRRERKQRHLRHAEMKTQSTESRPHPQSQLALQLSPYGNFGQRPGPT